jgi:YegS/Rv2252/BmrU family lipid kinase
MERDICLIVNPRAAGGRAEKKLPETEAAMRERGLRFRVERTRSLEHARELTRGAIERGEVAAAMGGDGLVGAVAGELVGSDGILAVLPGGRGNDFARKLRINGDGAHAIDVISGGKQRAVDVAECGGMIYLGIASAGIDSDIQVLANATRLPLGGMVYVYSTIRTLGRWRSAHWKVTIDGAAHEFDGYSVAIANSGVFGGGMYLVPDASLDDGLLDVVFSADVPKHRYLANLPKVFKGEHVHEPGLVFHQGREITFEADRTFDAYADGDPIAPLPTTVRVIPGQLNVLVPA